MKAVQPAELRMHLEFLASKELGGRYTLSPGFGIAARYLATRLEAYGYKGAGEKGSFFQPFSVDVSRTIKEASSLELNGKSHPYGDFYNEGTIGGAVTAPVVFVGYGISAPGQGHDDYAGLDVKGKIVLTAPGTPPGVDQSKITDQEQKGEAAKAHGAVALLEIPVKYYIEAMRKGHMRERAEQVKLSKAVEGQILRARLGPELSEEFLGLLGSDLNAIFKGRVPAPRDLGLTATLKLTVALTHAATQNVVATLEGSDSHLKNEYVAFSAHYDHLKTSDSGEIYPGADDDGSGTVAVLNIAKALSLARPKRSVLIIFHAGEELGLLGSEYNADYAPIVPLDQMAADLNMDMIGRSKLPTDTNPADAQLTLHDTIYVIGADRISPELQKISVESNSATSKMVLDYTLNDPNHPDRIYFRSDHWNYAKHGIPIIFYFDGVGVDYHQPTDTVDKIDWEKLARVARLALATGWRVANLDHRLKTK